jgi:ABC-type sulfate transport system permease component
MDYGSAHAFAALLLGVSFLLILTATLLRRREAAR